MSFEEVIDRLKDPTLGDLRVGSSIRDLYWLRDQAVPVLIDRIEALEAQIYGMREALAREGAINQETRNE